MALNNFTQLSLRVNKLILFANEETLTVKVGRQSRGKKYVFQIDTLNDLYKEYTMVTPKTIRRVVDYETWKNI